MRGARTLLVAVLGLHVSSLGTAHTEKVAAGKSTMQDDFQTSHDHNHREDSEIQRRQGATATATEGGRSAVAGGTASTADGSATCSGAGGSQATSCFLEQQEDQAITRQRQQQQQRQQEQRQRQQRQQQQQQEQEQARQGPGGRVAVKTGDQDGVRIDFLGTSDGTSPELVPPPSPPPRASAAKREQAGAKTPHEEQLAGRESLSAAEAAAAAEMPFGLLRCDGESYRYGKDGGLTVKSVCDHMLSKMMESAQRVRAM